MYRAFDAFASVKMLLRILDSENYVDSLAGDFDTAYIEKPSLRTSRLVAFRIIYTPALRL